MYYLITPKFKQQVSIDIPVIKTTFVGDKECHLQQFSDTPLFGIRYKLPDGNTVFTGGTIEPIFRFTKKEQTIKHIVWQVTEEFPEYLKIEVIFEKVLQRIFKAVGAFTLYAIPLDRNFVVKDEETADSVALALADSYPELFKENDAIAKEIEKDPDVDRVIERINKNEAPYAMILAKLYAWSHSEANTLNNKIMDALVERIFTRLEAKKWKKIRSFLLYKFMHGTRWLRSGFIQYISPIILARTYLALIEKCSINNETTQFLVGDLIFTGINKAQDSTYREIKEQEILRLKKVASSIIFAPEILSFYHLEKTGHKEETLQIYKKYRNRQTPANEYRMEFQKNFPTMQFPYHYFQSTVKNSILSLPLSIRLGYLPLLFEIFLTARRTK